MKCGCGKVLRLGGGAPKPAAPAQAAPVPSPPVKPVPSQPIPVAPIPIQPVDPIFGTGQKIDPTQTSAPPSGGSVGDLLGGAGGAPPSPYGSSGFESGYAPPAPIHNPAPRRQAPRRRSSSGSLVGPILSIIAGSLGMIYGLVMFIIFLLATIKLFSTSAEFGAFGSLMPSWLTTVITVQSILALVVTVVAAVLAGMSIYALVVSILEISKDYRSPKASLLAGISAFCFVGSWLLYTLIPFFIVMANTDFNSAVRGPRLSTRASASAAGAVVKGIFITLALMIIPVFVGVVGIIRTVGSKR